MTVNLANFSGPLELLFHLVQKNELDIYEIPIIKITEQFSEFLSSGQFSLENSAEFLNYSASLIWLKSKALLPLDLTEDRSLEEKWEDPHFEIIHHLVDYCKFKQAAQMLTAREEKGFYRGNTSVEPEYKKPLGIEHLSLEELALLFQDVLSKSAHTKKTIKGEVWKVSEKILEIRSLLTKNAKIPFHSVFRNDCCKDELIALFLAALEMMKLGAIKIYKENNMVVICRYEGN